MPRPTTVPSQPSSGDHQPGRIAFQCPACGTPLSLIRGHNATSGPCPVCGAHVRSPAPAAARRPTATGGGDHRRRRIRADDAIDHTDLENRESLRSLRVVALFIIAICACVAMAWLLADHLAR